MFAIQTDVTLEGFVRGALWCVLIVALALLCDRLGTRFAARSIRSIAARAPLRESSPRSEQRVTTLAGVAVGLIRAVVWTMACLLVLGVVGLDLGPFLAGASIVGVAVGFGAQSLVKDFFSGFFILMEDQYAVGDTITLADTTGTVEEINLRITRVRASDGTVWFVPNGEIRKVGNATKEWGRSIVDVLIPNNADLAAVTAAVAEEATALAEDPAWAKDVLEAPDVLGVESIAADNVTLRISTKTTPDRRTPFARELRARVTRRLRSDGVIAVEAPKPAPATPEN